jgi:hypothetical protein
MKVKKVSGKTCKSRRCDGGQGGELCWVLAPRCKYMGWSRWRVTVILEALARRWYWEVLMVCIVVWPENVVTGQCFWHSWQMLTKDCGCSNIVDIIFVGGPKKCP